MQGELLFKMLVIALLAEQEKRHRAYGAAQVAAWRAKHRERYRASDNAWHRLRTRRIAAAEGRTVRAVRLKGTVDTPEEKRARQKISQQRYNAKHPERVKEKDRRWKRNNKPKIRAYQNHKRRTDPQKNLERKIRRRIWEAFSKARSGNRSEFKTIKLLGCSFAELRDYITAKLRPGMTWEDVLTSRVHLDHKRPIASFDLTDAAQVAECFHFSNLQPLWAVDNMMKGAKLNYILKPANHQLTPTQ